jgi:hypothetical protein
MHRGVNFQPALRGQFSSGLDKRFFDEDEALGYTPANWRDKAHVSLFDWPGV